MNSFIGALGNALIAALTATIALLTGPDVTAFSDITSLQWAVLGAGALLVGIKDFQAVSARRLINEVTNSGDGI